MNIAFFTTFEVSPQKGGTERVTISVSNALREIYGYKCYSLYRKPCPQFSPAFFDGRAHVPMFGRAKFVRDFIIENHIDVFISQGDFALISNLRDVLPDGCKCRLVLAHHFEPGYDVEFFNKPLLRAELKSSPQIYRRIIALIGLLFFDGIRKWNYNRMRKLYNEAYSKSDRVVLLSSCFIDGFCDFGNIDNITKFSIIPNMLSFDGYLDKERLPHKKKSVLIVSRLSENQKRISLALDIWSRVKRNPESDGWILDIVGHGENSDDYISKVRNENIPDVVFHGVQSPEPFYSESSIFMMTSKSEGWGLTLTESMQFGCVPVAFDSFASVSDIIKNNEDGFIIKNDDVDDYVNRMIKLMTDCEMRRSMAIAGIENCKRFSKTSVAGKWHSLINSLNNSL